jgi:hypothetical protein
MSYRWVMRYLPDNLKCRPGFGGPSKWFGIDKRKGNCDKSKVARLSTSKNELQLLCDPAEKFVSIRSYSNASFVSLLLEKRFYDRLEKVSSNFGVLAETIINNAMVLALKELESVARYEEPKNVRTNRS